MSLAGCDWFDNREPAELEYVNDEVAETVEKLDEIVAHMSENFFMSASVRMSNIKVWEQLGAYYESNPDIFIMRGVAGMEISYREVGNVIHAEIFPQYEMFMKAIIAYEVGDTDILDDRERQVYDAAKRTVDANKANTTWATSHALHVYLRDSITYDKNYDDNPDAFNIYGALIDRKAVCQGYAQAYRVLLHFAGIENIMVTGTAGGENHAWNLVNYGSRNSDEWYHVDVTWNDREDGASNRFFNVNDIVLGASHRWERDLYPSATSKRLNYYHYSGTNASTHNELVAIFGNLYRINGGGALEVLCAWDLAMDELGFLNDYADAPQVSITRYGGDSLLTVIL